MKTEIGFGITLAIAITLFFLDVTGVSVILVVLLSLLSMFYFMGGIHFLTPKADRDPVLMLSAVAGGAISIGLVGFLFELLHWPGGNFMYGIGFIATAIILGLSIFMYQRQDKLKTYYKRMMIRTGVLVVLLSTFYLIPSAVILNVQFKGEPELIKLILLTEEDPQNEEYRKNLEAYWQQRDSIKRAQHQED